MQPTPQPDEFRHIPGFPGYAIDRAGRVISCLMRGRGAHTHVYNGHWCRRKSFVAKGGWLIGEWVVMLTVKRERRSVRFAVMVAELLALAFIGPKPEGHCVAFIDRDRTNIAVDNLCWMESRKACTYYAKRGEESSKAKLTEVGVIEIRREVHEAVMRGEYPPFGALGAKHGVTDQNIMAIAKGISWKHVDAGVPLWVPGKRVRPNGGNKLTEADVRAIRRRAKRGEHHRVIAASYPQVQPASIYAIIVNPKLWLQVKV